MANTSIPQNGCHRVVSREEGERLIREHWAALDAAGKPGSPERCRVMNERARNNGLIEFHGDLALVVKIGGEPGENGRRYCDVCDEGCWWKAIENDGGSDNASPVRQAQKAERRARETAPMAPKPANRMFKSREVV